MRGVRGGTLLLLWSLPAFASAVLAQSLEQLSAGSSCIVRGKVEGQQVRWGAGRRGLFTDTWVWPLETLKGDCPGPLRVRQPGGELEGVGQSVAGAARFLEGQEVLLFLEPVKDEPGLHRLRGLSSGAVYLEGQAGHQKAVRHLEGLTLLEPGPSLGGARQGALVEELGPSEPLLARVRRAVKP